MDEQEVSAAVPLHLQEALTSAFATRQKVTLMELTYLARQWQPTEDPPLYAPYMASSEVDQKFLGLLAKATSTENNYLSRFVRHSVRPVIASTKSQAIGSSSRSQSSSSDSSYFMARSRGFNYGGAVYPPHASTSSAGITGTYGLFPNPLAPRSNKSQSPSSQIPVRPSSHRQRSPAVSLGGSISKRLDKPDRAPPGLGVPTPFSTNPYSTITPTQNAQSSKHQLDPSVAAYLLPVADYTPHATAAFAAASTLADSLLPGSHPIRLSVKVEYVAYVYDCLKEADVSRRMARVAIRHVYEATEGMDDDSFEDAAELVGILGKMMRRGLNGGDSSSVAGASGDTLSRKLSSTTRATTVKNGDSSRSHPSNNGSAKSVSKARKPVSSRNSSDGRRGQRSPPVQQPTTWV